MSTFTCDIDESAVGHSFLKVGFTDILTEVGEGIIKLALGSTATFLATAVAASTVDIGHGPIILEQAAATSAVVANNQARTTVLSTAAATSFVSRESTLTLLSSGSGQSSVLPSRELTLLASADGVGIALPSGRMTLTLVSTALGQSGLFGYDEFVYLTAGVAQSAVVLTNNATTTALAQGAGQSAVVLFNGPGEVAVASGNGTSAVVLKATLNTVVQSSAVGASFTVVPSQFSAWVMNTENTAMSRYEDVPVQSLATIGGLVLGLGEGGLYEMTGATDDGVAIASSVRSGKTTLGFDALKGLGDIVLGYVCAGVMQIRISCYGAPVSGTFAYDLPVRLAAAPRANRVTPGKGMRSRYYQFEFFSDSAAFEIDTATVDVAVNNRRI